MKNIKESIILLTSTPYRDSDLIVNLLSAEHGKLSAVIYSGRKIGKSSSFLYQPGDLIEVEYQVRENTDFIKILNISGKSTLNTAGFPYNRFLFHSYLLELVSKISQPGNPSDDLFEILLENNQWKWKDQHSLFSIGRFIWMLAHHGGFGIDYHSCGNCQKPSWRFNENREAVFRKEQYRFQTNSGTLTCNSCTPVTNADELISSAMLKVMWYLDTLENEQANLLQIPRPVMIDVIKCLNQYLLQRYEFQPKSLGLFFDSMTP